MPLEKKGPLGIQNLILILKSEPKTPTYRIQRRRWRREIREREGDENIPPARETRMSSAGDEPVTDQRRLDGELEKNM